MKQLILIIGLLTTIDTFSQTNETFQNGLKCQDLKNYDSAIYYFNEYIKYETANDKKAFAYLRLSMVQESLDNIKEGIKLINKAIELDGQYLYYFYRGTLNFQVGKTGQAIEDFNKSINLNPNIGASYRWRGIAKWKKAKMIEVKMAEACHDIDKAIELGDEEAKRIQPTLCK
jgi:tetratricopeptide (TPR) repeat protein